MDNKPIDNTNKTADDWLKWNLANWDERVGYHLIAPGYDLTQLRAGKGTLHPIEEKEIGDVSGLRILHLQCHFGRDTLALAQRGASVVGVDFSGEAIQAARLLADELGLTDRARFIQSDVYKVTANCAESASQFDRVYVTWGAIYWLPDIWKWARTASFFLKPGGKLYLAEAHPAALVFDDSGEHIPNFPGLFAPYFHSGPLIIEDTRDYADENARLTHTKTYQWVHPLSSIIMAIIDSGMRLEFFTEHDSVPWKLFEPLVADREGMYRWPDKKWLPLSFSLSAVK